MARFGSTVDRISIREITRGMLIISPYNFRAILEVYPMNFGLKDGTEREGIISMFENFLNSLAFDVQILVVSRAIDVDDYVKNIEEYAAKEKNETLKEHALLHANFVRRLVKEKNLLQKKIYIVIPYDDYSDYRSGKESFSSRLLRALGLKLGPETYETTEKKSDAFSAWEERLDRARLQLNQRVSSVRNQLAAVGISTKELSTYEIAELLYYLYNPYRAEVQKLTEEEFRRHSSLAIIGFTRK
ncbi:MAG: hypothetical protein QXH08_00190 [Candidatus Hadarchaeales archaeon]